MKKKMGYEEYKIGLRPVETSTKSHGQDLR